MKFLLGLLALAACTFATYDNDGDDDHKPGCNSNNCARAVTGTRFPTSVQSAHRTDCSSFMKVVVTPAPTTITVTLNYKAKRSMEKRQITVVPSAVPTYASACSGTSKYSSACSCWGITKTTSTAPTPTVTVYVHKPCGGANLLTDPKNCGKCGNVCPSGVCNNGACTSPTCKGSVCGAYSNCGPGGECFCATTTEGAGFCMLNTPCAGLPTCTKDSECGANSVCAANTCCGVNVCLSTTVCAGAGPPAARRWFDLEERDYVNGTTVNRGTWVD